jgi:hypothetical protein
VTLNSHGVRITHNIGGKKPGMIEITQGPVHGISKGKNGHLIVVSILSFEWVLTNIQCHGLTQQLALGGVRRATSAIEASRVIECYWKPYDQLIEASTL